MPFSISRRAMLCAAAFSLSLVAMAGAAAADGIKPGSWKITTRVMMNGQPVPPEVKSRCLSADQAGDLKKTFGPEVGAMNTECRNTENKLEQGRLNWHIQCRGQIDIDVSGDFTFESETRYTAVVATKAFMAGAKVADSTAAIEGEHAGACP